MGHSEDDRAIASLNTDGFHRLILYCFDGHSNLDFGPNSKGDQ